MVFAERRRSLASTTPFIWRVSSGVSAMVKSVIGEDVEIKTTPTDDNRSYHISAEKIKNEIGFVPQFTIEDAVRDLKEAFNAGLIPNSFEDDVYVNVKRMKNINLV